MFLGGINNLRAAATLVVLDPEHFTGAAVEGGRPVFDDFVPAVEEARVIFARSCLNQHEPYNQAIHIHPQPEEITVDVHEHLAWERSPTVQYHFTPDLKLGRVSFSDVFASLHANAGHTLAQEEQILRGITILP